MSKNRSPSHNITKRLARLNAEVAAKNLAREINALYPYRDYPEVRQGIKGMFHPYNTLVRTFDMETFMEHPSDGVPRPY